MTVPTRYQDIKKSARSAYDAGRLKEAALLYQQAHNIAKQFRLPVEAFSAGVWAADSWRIAGQPFNALRLVIELLQTIPLQASPYDVLVAKRIWISVLDITNPNLEKEERQLESIELFLKENPQLPQEVIHIERSSILASQGLYIHALEQLELAWSKISSGSYKSQIASEAIEINLRMGERDAAGHWCNLLLNSDTNLLWSRALWHEACFQLALWDQNYDEAELESRKYDECAGSFQARLYEWSSLNYRVRALLLRNPNSDPTEPRHLARHLLSRVRGIFYNAHRLYNR